MFESFERRMFSTMKKFIFATILALLFVAALGTTVMADNGPHGGFSTSTPNCAGCHRMHSAVSSDGFLLVNTDVTEACLTCHDGAGAYTNVKDGYYMGSITGSGTLASPLGSQGVANAPLFGGGFVNSSNVHTFNGLNGYDYAAGYPGQTATTSTHSVAGLGGSDGYTGMTYWGSGNNSASFFAGAAATTSTELECTSCHDPHGNAGRSSSATATTLNTGKGGVYEGMPIPSYRLLRFQPSGSNGMEVTSGNTLTQWNTAAETTLGFTVREAAPAAPTTGTAVNYWYTANSEADRDPSVGMFRSRFENGAWGTWSNYSQQKGDTAFRSWGYQLPAIKPSEFVFATPGAVGTPGARPSSLYTCYKNDGTGTLPDLSAVNAIQVTATPGVLAAPRQGTDYDYNALIFPCPTQAPGIVKFNNNYTTLIGTGGSSAGRATVSFFCAQCHDRYFAAGGTTSRENASGDAYFMYRHSAGGSVSCVDCHSAHGSSAVMDQTNTIYPNASLTTSGSYLLKTDERTMCVKCHGHGVNFQYVGEAATPTAWP